MSENRNLKLGIIFSYITMAAGIVVSLTYTPFLLRALGTQQYGLYNMGQAAVSYLGLAEFGFGNAVVRYSAKYRAEGNKEKIASMYGMFLYIYGFLGALILGVGSLICLFSDHIFTVSTGTQGYFELRCIIEIMVLNLALTFFNTPYSSIITAYERFTFIKITNLVYTLLKPVVMIPLLIWGYKAIALSIVTFIFQQCLNFANVFYVRKVLKVDICLKREKMDFGILKEIIGYSFFIFLGAIVGQLNDNADNVILGIISGEAAVAVYSVGYQVNSYIQQIPSVISSVFFPRVTMRVTEGSSMEEMTDLMIRIGRIQYYILFLICSGFCLYGKNFIQLWAGEEYSIAYWIVLVLIIPAIIPNIQVIPVLIIQAMNRHQFKAVLYVVCAVLNVAFSIPMGIKFGPLGCAACTGITTFLTKGIVINWFYAKRIHLGIARFWKNIILLSIRFIPIVMGGYWISKVLPSGSWFDLFLQIIIYVFVFGIYVMCICFDKKEKQMTLAFFYKIAQR